VDFSLSVEQRAMVEDVGALARDHFAARAFSWEDEVPWPNLELLAERGYLGMCLPESVGGRARSTLDGILAAQTIAAVCPHTAGFFHAANTGPAGHLARRGSAALQAKYLTQVAAGRLVVGIAITEPQAGSDASSLATYAQVRGGTVAINGTKVFTAHAMVAGAFIVFVRSEGGFASILVERDAPGLEIGPAETYMSGERYCTLRFENCQVPAANIMVARSTLRALMAEYLVERLGNAARAVGVAQLALRLSKQHVETRRQFGVRLADMQGLRWIVADMVMRIEASQLLLYRAATNSGPDGPSLFESSLAKSHASETAKHVTDAAMQLHGALGVSTTMPLEWLNRLARGWTIAGGTAEIHRNIIASQVLHQLEDGIAHHGPALGSTTLPDAGAPVVLR
jgi:alkylation response protein AidB-like acyl-CoA dehydrogenase